MKRRLLVLGFALLFVSVWSGLAGAAELGLGGKIVYQAGNYAFTTLGTSETDGTTRYESSVSAPPLRFELGVTSVAWNLNGFLTTKSFGEAELDPELLGDADEGCGGVTAFGGDLAYRFDVGSFKLGPSIGYRSMQTTVGQKHSSEGGVHAWGRGFRTRGVRLGAEASATLSDRFSFSASLGCSPRLAVAEIVEIANDIADEGVHYRHCIVFGVPKPDKAYSFDLAISAAARVIPAVEIVGGYRYEGIRVELDPSASEFGASGYAVNASVFHIGAECRF
ncbi:MAG TPA: hypothetical protein DCL63_10825 [Firmicutes bacterium]|jgi:hypothetical protein|nr:hypothetical protein [Bacillota bacterium]